MITIILFSYAVAFLAGLGNPLVVPNIPLLVEEFHLSSMELTLVISCFALPGPFFIPLYGILCDRFGRRPVLGSALFLAFLGSLICFLAPTYTWLLFGRAVQGASITPLEALAMSLSADLFSGQERLKQVARVNTAMLFSVGIVPIIVSLLTMVGGWRSAFAFSGLLGLFLTLVCCVSPLPQVQKKKESLGEFFRHLGGIFISRRMLSLLSLRFFCAIIVFGGIYPFYALFLIKRFGMATEITGFIFPLYSIGMFIGSLAIQHYIQSISSVILGTLGGIFCCLSPLLFLVGSQIWHIFIAMACLGLGSGMTIALCVAHVSMAATPEARSSVLSGSATAFRLSQAVAPPLCGFFYGAFSFDGVFGFTSFIGFALVTTAFFTYRFVEKIEKSETPT